MLLNCRRQGGVPVVLEDRATVVAEAVAYLHKSIAYILGCGEGEKVVKMLDIVLEGVLGLTGGTLKHMVSVFRLTAKGAFIIVAVAAVEGGSFLPLVSFGCTWSAILQDVGADPCNVF